MARGDVFSDLQSIASGAYLDIQPAGTMEATIHNIYHERDVSLEFYDGANALIFDSSVGVGAYNYYSFHVRNSLRLRVRNDDPAPQLIGYDGIETHT